MNVGQSITFRRGAANNIQIGYNDWFRAIIVIKMVCWLFCGRGIYPLNVISYGKGKGFGSGLLFFHRYFDCFEGFESRRLKNDVKDSSCFV